jgi:hypothetical protein
MVRLKPRKLHSLLNPRDAMFHTLSIAIATAMLVTLPMQSTAANGWSCLGKPVEPCIKRHARLSSQNGTPFRLWLIGTSRVMRIDETDMPDTLDRYLEMTSDSHSYIYGDFEVCPLEPDQQGHMRAACVANAERLVIQPLARDASPFRLRSTWPQPAR